MNREGFEVTHAEGLAMSVHDWTRVDAGLFHHFHHRWIDSLTDALNAGALPSEFFALVEQRIRGPIPDVLTLQLSPQTGPPPNGTAGLAVATAPPRVRHIKRSEAGIYAKKTSRITVRHRHGDIVAVIEIVSPGNKSNRAEFRTFVQKSADLIRQGVHLLVIDLFPPGPRDPNGLGNAIWNEFDVDIFEPPVDKRLTLASFDAGPEQVAYLEFVAVGDALPEMPLFLRPEFYIPAPLDATYQTAWQVFPSALKGLLETPAS
jgi:hypothetical protein